MQTKSRQLKSHLLKLVLAGLLPVVLFATATGYLLIEAQRATFRRGAEERSLAMLSAVDAQLNRAVDAIQVLGLSESLSRGDIATFRGTAQRVLATQTDWVTITVALPSGERVMDLLVPPGEPLPAIQRVEDSFERALQARGPVIGNLAEGMATSGWNYAVRTVVRQGDAVQYVLTAIIRPDAMARLVRAQNLPAGWVGVVLDANDRMVSRTVDPGTSLGQMPSPNLRDALARAPSDWFRWTTEGGVDIYTAYRQSAASGWTFALGIPAPDVVTSETRAYTLFGIGLLSALLLAYAFARVVSRRVTGPIAALAGITERVRRGERVTVPQDFGVTELAEFARTLGQTLAALHEREERLQLALSAGRMGHWEWNLDNNQVLWSAEMHAIHGIAQGSHNGPRTGAYQQMLHPDDRAAVEQAITHSLQHGEHLVEYRIIRPDGTLRWLEGRGKVFRDAAGKPARMIGLCTDITDRKLAEQALQESEARFREMADTAPAILWVTSPDGRARFLSRGWYEFTGQSEVQAFAKDGFGWLDAVHPDDAERASRCFLDANAAREAFALDYRLRCADGAYRWAIDAGKPRFDAVGNFLGFVGAVIDIDDRKRFEEELKANAQALREADRHKDEFLATLSHELRNPLAALTTAAHVLHMTAPADERTAAVHGVIERQTQHITRLIEDLLDMTRVRLGKLSLHRERMDLAALVAAATAARRDAGAFTGRAEVVVDTAEAWIDGDTARMEQVYGNILDNALKFTPATGTVRVAVRRDGNQALLVVSDDGQGIAPDMLPRVFELFVQGEDAPRRTQGGLGLGLALVRRIVQLHGGSVTAFSAGQGQGTTITIRLPAVAPPAAARAPETGEPRNGRQCCRVLLVEDNDDVRRMTREVLELEGHVVYEADTGAQGLALAAQLKPDAVLLDIGLPDIDGYDVARRLRAAAAAQLVLIALSGHAEDSSRARGAGFDAHVIKPAGVGEVVDLLDRLVQRERSPAP